MSSKSLIDVLINGKMHSVMRRLLAAWLLALIVPIVLAAPERPPNIVFFLVDDLGWSNIGVFGSTFYETPNIDRLAEQGVRFTNAYAAAHVCSPTRAASLHDRQVPRAACGLTDWLPGRREHAFEQIAERREAGRPPARRGHAGGGLQGARLPHGHLRQVASRHRRGGSAPPGLRRASAELPPARPHAAATFRPT